MDVREAQGDLATALNGLRGVGRSVKTVHGEKRSKTKPPPHLNWVQDRIKKEKA